MFFVAKCFSNETDRSIKKRREALLNTYEILTIDKFQYNNDILREIRKYETLESNTKFP
jgi:ribosomal protein S17E